MTHIAICWQTSPNNRGFRRDAGLFRRKNEHNAPAVHGGPLLDFADIIEFGGDSLDQLEAFLDMGVFSATKDDRKDHLVLLRQEQTRAVELEIEIMIADFRAQTDFLVLAQVAVPLVMPLLLLVLELTIVHDTADWRLFLGSNLYQIQFRLARPSHGIVCANDA